MNNDKDIPGLSFFDRAIGSLHGLPDVVSTKATTLRVVPPFGMGSHLYAVQTFRQSEIGDTIFLEHVSENGTTRLVIPPAVADVIARQREQLVSKVRSRAGKRTAQNLKDRGIQPGFMRKKKKGAV
jgi:hypothetical protein